VLFVNSLRGGVRSSRTTLTRSSFRIASCKTLLVKVKVKVEQVTQKVKVKVKGIVKGVHEKVKAKVQVKVKAKVKVKEGQVRA
jgi:hypothetical protein